MPEGVIGLALESEWDFSQARFDLDDDLVAVGADLAPETLCAAYCQGVFPMGIGDGGAAPMGWWSPQERGVLERGKLRVTSSLRKSCRKFRVTVDVDFDGVIEACADPSRPGAWITREVADSYRELHRRGIAHSVEAWAEGQLVGGLYGVSIGGLFAGESMFHRATDASKVALCGLVEVVYAAAEPRLIDVQWATPHLSSLGVEELPRRSYLSRLPSIVQAAPVRWPSPGSVVALR